MIEKVFIKQGIRKIELEAYLKKELNRAGFTGLEIVKTPLVTRIVLNVARPGLAIGKEGQNIRQLTSEMTARFGIENPQLEIQETPQSGLNAVAIVNKMASLLERGFSWRSVAFRTMRDVMDAGAQGAELVLKGKLAGKGGRKRKQRIAEGYMKKVGAQVELVDYAKASAYPKAGAIGIKLRIIRPGVVFPDKIDITKYIMAKKEADAPKKETKAEENKETAEETTEAKAEVKEDKKAKKKPAKEKAANEGKKEAEPKKEEVKATKEKPEAEKKEKAKDEKPKTEKAAKEEKKEAEPKKEEKAKEAPKEEVKVEEKKEEKAKEEKKAEEKK